MSRHCDLVDAACHKEGGGAVMSHEREALPSSQSVGTMAGHQGFATTGQATALGWHILHGA